MAHLLHIDASPRGERSHSRKLTREFVEAWKQVHLTDTVSYRDVGRNPLPHVDEAWIAAAFTPPSDRTPQMWESIRISDQLVDELLAADVYVFGIPMYNFGVPSGFKAYIDQIVRFGRTCEFVPDDREAPYKPLVHGKKMFIITAQGDSGYGPGERNEKMNHLDPHLRTAFGYIGVTDITFIHVENDEFGGLSLAQSLAHARAKIAGLVSLKVA